MAEETIEDVLMKAMITALTEKVTSMIYGAPIEIQMAVITNIQAVCLYGNKGKLKEDTDEFFDEFVTGHLKIIEEGVRHQLAAIDKGMKSDAA